MKVAIDRLLVAVAIVAAWQAANAIAGSYWIASPWMTVTGLVNGIADGRILTHAGYTLQAAAWGFVLGGVPGVLLPFVVHRSPWLAAVLEPFLVAGYGLPKLALAPLFILLFGIGIESKVAVVASVVFFILYFNTRAGIESLDLRLVRMARVAGAGPLALAREVVWPGSVPFIFAGFRIALPYAISGVVIAELISANRGLGFLVQSGAMDFDTRTVFVALLAITLIVVLANWGVEALEAWLLRWRPRAGRDAFELAAEGQHER